jgi:hypothetical protein
MKNCRIGIILMCGTITFCASALAAPLNQTTIDRDKCEDQLTLLKMIPADLYTWNLVVSWYRANYVYYDGMWQQDLQEQLKHPLIYADQNKKDEISLKKDSCVALAALVQGNSSATKPGLGTQPTGSDVPVVGVSAPATGASAQASGAQ